MFDQFTAAYAADNESNAFNALYERPAMLALLGDLGGKRVLDVGCGSGALGGAILEPADRHRREALRRASPTATIGIRWVEAA
jgi:2-polyprenyl-3-methyl-5-hydroxy-6-metoxy-1,4-benzoquinol methylase